MISVRYHIPYIFPILYSIFFYRCSVIHFPQFYRFSLNSVFSHLFFYLLLYTHSLLCPVCHQYVDYTHSNSPTTWYKSCSALICALKQAYGRTAQAIPYYRVTNSIIQSLLLHLFFMYFTYRKSWISWILFSLLRRRDGSNWVSFMYTTISAYSW